jgi:hypothetical protein
VPSSKAKSQLLRGEAEAAGVMTPYILFRNAKGLCALHFYFRHDSKARDRISPCNPVEWRDISAPLL